MSTGNPTVFRTLNERAALELLLRHGSLTRAELEFHTGLSKASAAEVLRRLENGRLARKAGTKPGNAGPAAQLWELNGSASWVAGLDLTARAVEVSVSDLTGEVLGRHQAEAPGVGTDAVAFLTEAVQAAAHDAGITLDDLDQIVLGVPGVVEAGGHRLSQAVQLSGWSHLDDLGDLREQLGSHRFRLENDVNLVAIRELEEHKGTSFVLFWVGSGVGAGVVLNDVLWRGVTGRGGEVGSVVVPDPVSRGRLYGPDGGPLGALLGTAPLAELAGAHGLEVEPTLRAVTELLRTDPPAGFLDDVASRVALGVTAAVGVLDPGYVVLGGPVCTAAGEPLRSRVAELLAPTGLAPVTVAVSRVSGNAVLEGAVRHALDLAREQVFHAGTAGRTGLVNES
ncbi:ROK family transcriptional regulator [Streptosporangium saharense]|uniref:Putative NBD/HSP70 family sugar kinase n=2 Tax=Streptosporangium TaxID=2000 RepID=A0A7W7VPH2_9ACTN|nr:ROK family transcriptional regulator [Streptosporangium saharense]MBB4917265.1 putative NBD/HSP70 family sugar kinase [Streptosporangium saharense]